MGNPSSRPQENSNSSSRKQREYQQLARPNNVRYSSAESGNTSQNINPLSRIAGQAQARQFVANHVDSSTRSGAVQVSKFEQKEIIKPNQTPVTSCHHINQRLQHQQLTVTPSPVHDADVANKTDDKTQISNPSLIFLQPPNRLVMKSNPTFETATGCSDITNKDQIPVKLTESDTRILPNYDILDTEPQKNPKDGYNVYERGNEVILTPTKVTPQSDNRIAHEELVKCSAKLLQSKSTTANILINDDVEIQTINHDTEPQKTLIDDYNINKKGHEILLTPTKVTPQINNGTADKELAKCSAKLLQSEPILQNSLLNHDVKSQTIKQDIEHQKTLKDDFNFNKRGHEDLLTLTKATPNIVNKTDDEELVKYSAKLLQSKPTITNALLNDQVQGETIQKCPTVNHNQSFESNNQTTDGKSNKLEEYEHDSFEIVPRIISHNSSSAGSFVRTDQNNFGAKVSVKMIKNEQNMLSSSKTDLISLADSNDSAQEFVIVAKPKVIPLNVNNPIQAELKEKYLAMLKQDVLTKIISVNSDKNLYSKTEAFFNSNLREKVKSLGIEKLPEKKLNTENSGATSSDVGMMPDSFVDIFAAPAKPHKQQNATTRSSTMAASTSATSTCQLPLITDQSGAGASLSKEEKETPDEMIPIKCPICEAMIPALEISEHVREHDNDKVHLVRHAQKIDCPLTKIFNKCNWTCEYTTSEEMTKQITVHMRNCHGSHLKYPVHQEVNIVKLIENNRYVFFNCMNGIIFLTNVKIVLTRQSERKVFINCQVVGSSAAEWKYAIEFYRRSGHRSFRYEDTCQQDLEPFEAKTRCAQISAKFLETFQENGELKFKFHFDKVTERKKMRGKRA